MSKVGRITPILIFLFILSWVGMFFGSSLTEDYGAIFWTFIFFELALLGYFAYKKKFKILIIMGLVSLFVILNSVRAFVEEKYCWDAGRRAGVGSKLVPANEEEKAQGFVEVNPDIREHMNCHKNYYFDVEREAFKYSFGI